MEDYKRKLKNFLDGLSGESDASSVSRLPQLVLTHFTNRDAASSIIRDGIIRLNEKGYISLSALNPIEFRTIINRTRDYGFAFFPEDLIAAGFDLYSPVAYARDDGIVSEIQGIGGNFARRLLTEPTPSQTSLKFLNQMEVRSASEISISNCSLFFREEDLMPSEAERLNDEGIFQLPYSIKWLRDHFVDKQMWFYREEQDSVEFFDNRNCTFSASDLITRLRPHSDSTPTE